MIQISIETAYVIYACLAGVVVIIFLSAFFYGLWSVLSSKARSDSWMREHGYK